MIWELREFINQAMKFAKGENKLVINKVNTTGGTRTEVQMVSVR
jgi:hypothetical protein